KALDPFQISDESLASMRADGVPPAVLAKLAALKGRTFDSRDAFARALAEALPAEELQRYQGRVLGHSAGARFTITATTLAALRASRDRAQRPVPEAVLAKLGRLRGLGFKTREAFVKEIEGALSQEEQARYRDLVLDRARTYWRHQDEKIQGVVL